MNGSLRIDVYPPSEALPEVTQIALEGRLDATTVAQLEKALDLALEALTGSSPKAALLIDMQGLTYVSSSGLRVLLSTRATTRRREIRLILCTLSLHVREVFDLVGFSALFEIYDTTDSAITALRQS